MVAAAVSQVVDEIYFEDRVTAVGHVGGLTGTAGILTLALAAKEDSPARGGRAHRVEGGPGGASACWVGFPVLGDAAQLVMFRARIVRRTPDAPGVREVICNRRVGQAQVLKEGVVVLALEVGVQELIDRDAGQRHTDTLELSRKASQVDGRRREPLLARVRGEAISLAYLFDPFFAVERRS